MVLWLLIRLCYRNTVPRCQNEHLFVRAQWKEVLEKKKKQLPISVQDLAFCPEKERLWSCEFHAVCRVSAVVFSYHMDGHRRLHDRFLGRQLISGRHWFTDVVSLP